MPGVLGVSCGSPLFKHLVHERRIYDFTAMLIQIGVLKAKPA
jgi:hypothetical protein